MKQSNCTPNKRKYCNMSMEHTKCLTTGDKKTLNNTESILDLLSDHKQLNYII